MSERRWKLEVQGSPATKARARHDLIGGRGRTPDRTSSYEQLVAGAALEAGVRWAEGFVFEVRVGVCLPNFRPKDGDNILKVVMDGLQRAGKACLPSDDMFHVPSQGIDLLDVSRARPRLEISIWRRPARGQEAGSPERER